MDSIKNQSTETMYQDEVRNGVYQLRSTPPQEVGISQGLSVTSTNVPSKVNTNQELNLPNTQNQFCEKTQTLKGNKPFKLQFSFNALDKVKAIYRSHDDFKDFDKIFDHRATQKIDQLLADEFFCIEDFVDSKHFICDDNAHILKKIIENFISSEHIRVKKSYYDFFCKDFTVEAQIISKDTKVKIEQCLTYDEENINPWAANPDLPITDKEYFIKTCIVNLCKDMALDVWVAGFKANFYNAADKTSMAYIHGFSYWDRVIGVDVIDKQKAIQFQSNPQNIKTLSPFEQARIIKGCGSILIPITELINLENNSANLRALRVRLGKKYFEALFSDEKEEVRKQIASRKNNINDSSDSDSESVTGSEGCVSAPERPVVESVADASDVVDVRDFEETDDEIDEIDDEKYNEYDMTGYIIV